MGMPKVPIAHNPQDFLSHEGFKYSQNQRKRCLIMTDFEKIMERVNYRTTFATVEKTDNGALLLAQHISGNYIAIMMKFNSSEKLLTIEGKATDSSILTLIMNFFCDLIV